MKSDGVWNDYGVKGSDGHSNYLRSKQRCRQSSFKSEWYVISNVLSPLYCQEINSNAFTPHSILNLRALMRYTAEHFQIAMEVVRMYRWHLVRMLMMKYFLTELAASY